MFSARLGSMAVFLVCILAARIAMGQKLINLSNETFVATVVASDPPYDADRTGSSDATAAIQKALDAVTSMGGGVVYLPAGRYLLNGTLKLGYCDTLLGEGEGADAVTHETLLIANGAPGDKPFIDANATGCGLINLAIWYPNQRPGDVVAYPWTISATGSQLRNITLYDSFDGIDLVAANTCIVRNIRGTVLNRGLYALESTEFSWMSNVDFSNRYWRESYPRLNGRSMTARESAALERFTRTHLIGLRLGRIDGMAISNYDSPDARTPILIEKDTLANQNRVFGFGGVVSEFHGKRTEFGWDPWYYGMHYADLDNVPEAMGMSYKFLHLPLPARRDTNSLYDVRKAPFHAAGDGVKDDTKAIQDALNAAGESGGGTVYLPQGVYRVSRPLTVPSGVELRGCLGVGKARAWRDTCTIAAYCDPNPTNPLTAPALITLHAHSGVRSLEIVYPNQPYDIDKLIHYPFTIRGEGDGVWIADMLLINSYLGMDLASHRCDDHRVSDVWGTAFEEGLVVGGGSKGGKLERIAFSYGPWLEWGGNNAVRTPELTAKIIKYWHEHTIQYIFGDCVGERTWGLVGFDPLIHMLFRKDPGGGCRDARFWLTLLDVAHSSNLKVEAGGDISFYELFATGGGGDKTKNWLEISPNFKGRVSVYAKTIQQSFLNHPYDFLPGRVRFFNERSLIDGKKCMEVTPSKSPLKKLTAKSVSFPWRGSNRGFLQVDLGREYVINRFDVVNDREYDIKAPNIREADLWTSLNGLTYQLAGRLDMSGLAWGGRPVEPIKARYVRLQVKGDGKNGSASVFAFRVYAENQ